MGRFLYILPTGGEIGPTTTLEGLYDFFWGNVLFLKISQNVKGAWNCIAHIFGPPGISMGFLLGKKTLLIDSKVSKGLGLRRVMNDFFVNIMVIKHTSISLSYIAANIYKILNTWANVH